MIITNTTSNEYYLGDSDYYLGPQGTCTIPNTVYQNDDIVANKVNNLYDSGAVTVTSTPDIFPRSGTVRGEVTAEALGSPVVKGPFIITHDQFVPTTGLEITGVTLGSPLDTIRVEGNHVDEFVAGGRALITGSTGNDGSWLIQDVVFDTDHTNIVTTDNSIDDATVDGTVRGGLLTDPVAFYTPMVGEILLDLWYYVTEVWDGDVPKGDFGLFEGTLFGFFNDFTTISLNQVAEEAYGTGLLNMTNDNNTAVSLAGLAYDIVYNSRASSPVPSLFTQANPLKFIANNSGHVGDIISDTITQGEIQIYIKTAMPIQN